MKENIKNHLHKKLNQIIFNDGLSVFDKIDKISEIFQPYEGKGESREYGPFHFYKKEISSIIKNTDYSRNGFASIKKNGFERSVNKIADIIIEEHVQDIMKMREAPKLYYLDDPEAKKAFKKGKERTFSEKIKIFFKLK